MRLKIKHVPFRIITHLSDKAGAEPPLGHNGQEQVSCDVIAAALMAQQLCPGRRSCQMRLSLPAQRKADARKGSLVL